MEGNNSKPITKKTLKSLLQQQSLAATGQLKERDRIAR
jgi:hypothetical protein